MAVTNTYAITISRDDIVRSSLRKITATGNNIIPSSDQTTAAVMALNVIVQALKVESAHNWTIEEVTQVLTASTIVLGTDTLYYDCIRNHIATAANKPVIGAEWTSYWRLSTAIAATATWTLSASYVSSNNYSLATSIIGIEDNAFIRRGSTDTKVQLIDREAYMSIEDKYTTGVPTHIYFVREDTPQIYLWPIPTTLTDVLHYHVIRKAMDVSMTEGSSNVDYPGEWSRPLIFELAHDLAPEYNVPVEKMDWLRKTADRYLSQVMGSDNEHLYQTIKPDRQIGKKRI